MVRYLIKRPIAVLVTFVILIIIGASVIFRIPVSLLPNIDVPRIIIRVNFPNASAYTVENQVLKLIRGKVATADHLKSVESEASNHGGLVYLDFEYGSRMDLAYIDINEKIDLLTGVFPPGLERPQVIRINTTDIPVIRVQVVPNNPELHENVSAIAESVLKRRIEQLPGVSAVDINGRKFTEIGITPDQQRMRAFGITMEDVINAIMSANKDLGGISLRDGQYRFFIRLRNHVGSIRDLQEIIVKSRQGKIIPLQHLASVRETNTQAQGHHLFNDKEALVLTIQGQPESRMNELVPQIKSAVLEFRKQYPLISFSLTQDQSFLLDAGLSNLYQDIMIGGVLTIALLFAFLGNWASPTLMSISIPVSLIITFIFFFVFNISFNIISLSGLALGIGMLIDNSIVVVDHITRKRISGLSMIDSCVAGTSEMAAPVISQVLTTVAVYAPLIILSGLAGALILDQSIALTISLGVSLLAAFVLTPVLYNLLLKIPPEKLKEDTRFYRAVSNGYHKMIYFILKHRAFFFGATLALMPVGIVLAFFIPFESLPYIEKNESLSRISWNEPIDADENLRRTQIVLQAIRPICLLTESEVGKNQFLFQKENSNFFGVEIYYKANTENEKVKADKRIRRLLHQQFPNAAVQIIDAPNAFTKLFVNTTPFLEARFKSASAIGQEANYEGLYHNLLAIGSPFQIGSAFKKEPNIDLILDDKLMSLYGVSREDIYERLNNLFGNKLISETSGSSQRLDIGLSMDELSVDEKLNAPVQSNSGSMYPLRTFLQFRNSELYSHVTADNDGQYKAIQFENVADVNNLMNKLRATALKNGYVVDFNGRYFENRDLMFKMMTIFILVLLLLYLLLAIEFESLTQPLIVMLTIPLGITGAMFLLKISGGTLNVMSAIGFVVVLGLIVDDPILKIETLNRLSKQYLSAGYVRNEELLQRLIHEAGDICLKPLLMVSLTTSIALLPVLFIDGIGNDLQRPMALVIIGGLTIGTFFTTWFIPLAYWYSQKWIHKI